MDKSKYDGNGVFDKGAANEKYADFFNGGTSFRNGLSTEQVIIDNVTFPPSCRTKWHKHHTGEILLITGGIGWHQIEGEDAVKIQQGDVINVKAGTTHWHGAKKDCWLTHIAITVPSDDMEMEVLHDVSDDIYNNLD